MRLLALGCALSILACGGRVVRTLPALEPLKDSYDFGTVPVLNEVLEPVIPVRNLGKARLTLSEVKLEGDGAFTLKSFPNEVEPAGDGKIVISFIPPKEQAYLAVLRFETNDAEHAKVEVRLTGTGSTRAVMVVNPEKIDFGRVNECGCALQTFTIESKGTADLKLTDLSFAEGTPATVTRIGSWTTPSTVKFMEKNGMPGVITLTVKYCPTQGAPSPLTGAIHIGSTDPDKQSVSIPLSATLNRAPVAKVVPLGNGAPGQTVMLDGAGSEDADMDLPLTYQWILRLQPLSSNTSISAPSSATTGMTLDPMLPGSYEVQLDVTDAAGAKNCAPVRQTIVAAPAQKLLVELFWDNADSDIDLHLLRTPTTIVGSTPDDCHYANLKPDWGMPGTDDDPVLLRDALTGYGPEVFGYVNPIDSTYRVVADFASDHLSATPITNVTLRVYIFGVVKFEQKKTLMKKGDRWNAVDITWPTGSVVAVP